MIKIPRVYEEVRTTVSNQKETIDGYFYKTKETVVQRIVVVDEKEISRKIIESNTAIVDYVRNPSVLIARDKIFRIEVKPISWAALVKSINANITIGKAIGTETKVGGFLVPIGNGGNNSSTTNYSSTTPSR